MFGGSPPPPPLSSSADLAVFLTLFLGLWVVAVFLHFRLDRKWSIRFRGRSGTEGRFTAVVQAGAAVPADVAARISRAAMEAVGGHQMTDVDDHTLIGWVGSNLTNIARWAEYQLLVTRAVQPDGSTLFTCCSRRRNPMVWLAGTDRSAALARQLAAEVVRRAPA